MVTDTIATLAAAGVSLDELAENRFSRIREAIGDARVVLIGEETHGTQEFYHLRAEITKALIEEEDFSLVLCESDFPTFYELHRFVGGNHSPHRSRAVSSPLVSPTSSSRRTNTTPAHSFDHSQSEQKVSTTAGTKEAFSRKILQSPLTAEEVMEVLKTRFPVWMWRNEVVCDFVKWLQTQNQRREVDEQGGTIPLALLGLDIYSMFASTDQVIAYLDTVDPEMAERARQRYSVVQRFRPYEKEYCRAVLRGQVAPQHNPLRRMLDELNNHATEFKTLFRDGDEYFSAHENARVAMAAEEYYRQSYFGTSLTWNIRDRAMAEMIGNALQFHDEKLRQQGEEHPRSRAVVWAHNSHIGDAAATDQYEERGQVNVGCLVREVLGVDQCFLLGLSTCTGNVRAARRWNGKDSIHDLNPSIRDSTGDLLHRAALKRSSASKNFGVLFRSNSQARRLTEMEVRARDVMQVPHLERFVGVQYVKQTERQSHYYACRMSSQFDMIIHMDVTSALRPLPENVEPHVPPSSSSLRPGTTDYSKWDRLAANMDADETEEE